MRQNINSKFRELLPVLHAQGAVAFRKKLIPWIMETYTMSHPTACAQYNHAFAAVRATDPDLVVGLQAELHEHKEE